eukprot:scaffold123353_cov42-Phaeocystis_antarctica.AAC.1
MEEEAASWNDMPPSSRAPKEGGAIFAERAARRCWWLLRVVRTVTGRKVCAGGGGPVNSLVSCRYPPARGRRAPLTGPRPRAPRARTHDAG